MIPSDAAPQRQFDSDARGPPVLPPYHSPAARGVTGLTTNADLTTAIPPVRAHSGSPVGAGPSKKRRLDDDYAGFGGGDAMADLDDDVAELLRAESGGS